MDPSRRQRWHHGASDSSPTCSDKRKVLPCLYWLHKLLIRTVVKWQDILHLTVPLASIPEGASTVKFISNSAWNQCHGTDLCHYLLNLGTFQISCTMKSFLLTGEKKEKVPQKWALGKMTHTTNENCIVSWAFCMSWIWRKKFATHSWGMNQAFICPYLSSQLWFFRTTRTWRKHRRINW